jgi:hypothetical protein
MWRLHSHTEYQRRPSLVVTINETGMDEEVQIDRMFADPYCWLSL